MSRAKRRRADYQYHRAMGLSRAVTICRLRTAAAKQETLGRGLHRLVPTVGQRDHMRGRGWRARPVHTIPYRHRAEVNFDALLEIVIVHQEPGWRSPAHGARTGLFPRRRTLAEA
jgi:hypothetical protein